MTMLSSAIVEELVSRINVKVTESHEFQTILEPFTGEELATVPIATEADALAAFEAAREAQREWAAVPLDERAKILDRFATHVYKNRNRLLDVVQAETGKARSHALEEVLDVMLVARFYSVQGPAWLKPQSIAGMMPAITKSRVVRKPVGVVGVIAPWNYPLSLAISDAIAAIMAGNGVVLKPDSQTPLSGLLALEFLEEAGLPAGLFQIVTGRGREVGSTIVDRCDYLMFTGSSATGQRLGTQIGGRLVGYSAELGGKNAMIVDADSNIDNVLEVAVRACYSNAGQLCISMERIYAVGEAYDKLLEALPARIKRMKLAAGKAWDVEMGSLTGPDQLETVTAHVQDAVAKGATLLAGGKARPDLGPYFFEPTLLTDVPHDAMCYREETFGPVVALYRAETLDDAVAQTNDTDYGLNTSIMSNNLEAAQHAAEAVNSGMVNINEGYGSAWSSLEGPAGGWGISGIGVRHGKEGLLKYTHAKTIAAQSQMINLGGPTFLPSTAWAGVLSNATRLMRNLPGR